MELERKTIVVTGGNSGIGEAIVRAAAKLGANVVIDFVEGADNARKLVEDVQRAGGHALAVEADVSRVADLQKLIRAAVEKFGRLDVMVNNAGIETRSSLLETTESEFDSTIDVNLKSAFFGTKIAAQQFLNQKGAGLVINMSSVHEDWPMPGNTSYCVSKGGMRMLTRTAGAELGPMGIRIVNVAPGAVATPINEETMNNPKERKALNKSIPLRTVASPQDIADIVVFLASDGARYMTATTVFVDGGIMQGSSGL
ncbi:MAG TPA: glucose 1-dehydrogenase [Galbitalea sp.]|jgi:glucose 1-dehydrogenase|nr:glucose 1-dehydrogenase [Galbitalea sp.]